VARLEELDLAALTSGPQPDMTSMPDVAAYLAGNVKLMTSRRHVRATRARLELLLDETARPAMEAGHRSFLGMLAVVLEKCGHPDPDHSYAGGRTELNGGVTQLFAIGKYFDTVALDGPTSAYGPCGGWSATP